VTSTRDLDVVRTAVSLGVVQYLVKPFTSALLREKLERYAAYHGTASIASRPLEQHEVDKLLTTLRGSTTQLPKGFSEATLQEVIDTLRTTSADHSAAQVGEQVGVARVTARRYLEYLVELSLAAGRSATEVPAGPNSATAGSTPMPR